MNSHLSRALRVAALAFLTGCAALNADKASKAKTPPSAAPTLVGRIASIPADQRFVLIESYGTWKIEAGTVLTTRGLANRTANLLITGESLGQFAAADLQAGHVQVGDAVYSHHIPTPPDPPSTSEAIDNQSKTPPN